MIIFIKSNENGSGIELGDNLSATINISHPSNSLSKKQLIQNIDTINNSIIVFIKYIDYVLADKLKQKNNRVYFFIVDDYPQRDIPCDLDGIIYSSNRQKLDFSTFFTTKNNYIYYHHYSIFYDKIIPKTKNIGYFVAPENISQKLNKLNNIDIHTNFSNYKNFISEYFFHIEHREEGSKNFLYKPCIKLSTSAFAESVFICSKDSSYIELLPSDYPYFLSNDINSSILEDIINSRNTNIFKYGLNIILDLKKQLHINNTSKKLLDFLLK